VASVAVAGERIGTAGPLESLGKPYHENILEATLKGTRVPFEGERPVIGGRPDDMINNQNVIVSSDLVEYADLATTLVLVSVM